MKELSIEEKAKAYDEALEMARKINNGEGIAAPPDWTTCEVIFPQLKEPKIEDEKIREWLIGYFQQYKIDGMEVVYANDLKVDDIIAWLKKQENKVVDCQQNHQDVHPHSCIVLEDFNGGEGFYKLHLDYLNKEQVKEVEALVSKWNLTDEDIKNCIGLCLTDVDEQRFKDFNTNLRDCLAWFKKQGEPTEINPSEFDLRLNRLLKQFETLPKEELESSLSFYLNVIQNDGTYKNKKPKFEAGSWITNGEFVWLISNVGDFDYEVISPKGECVTDTISHVDEYFHLWSIKDAKDGDVLTANIHHWEIGGNVENFPVRVPTIFIYRETKTDNKNIHACVSLFDNTTLNIYKSMYYIDDFGIKNIHPATKEQQELLFLTMKNAGYEWDSEKKEPKKIEEEFQLKEGKFYKCIKSYYYLGGGQYWFDKDKVYFCKMDGYLRSSDNNLINVYDCKDWQSHFCPYPEKSTWSEEDENMLEKAIKLLDKFGGDRNAGAYTLQEMSCRNCADWLKSLKQRLQ